MVIFSLDFCPPQIVVGSLVLASNVGEDRALCLCLREVGRSTLAYLGRVVQGKQIRSNL